MEMGIMPLLRVSSNSIPRVSKRKPGGLALEPAVHVLSQASQPIVPGHCLRGKLKKGERLVFFA